MLPLMSRAVQMLLAASLSIGGSELYAQQARSPLDALLLFVERDAPMAVHPDTRPDRIARVFLRLGLVAREREALGSVSQEIADRLGVEIVDDTTRFEHMMVRLPHGGAHVREEGVFVSVGNVEVQSPDTLAIAFAYYVTMRPPRRNPRICQEERRIVISRAREPDTGAEIIESRWMGGC